jgi:hypothetical protein
MSTYTKISFWSLLVIGVICAFAGGILFPYGPDKRTLAEVLMLLGAGLLLLWVLLLFVWYRKKTRQNTSA